jgi:hypothetical protein
MDYNRKTSMVATNGYGITQSATGATISGLSALIVHAATVDEEYQVIAGRMVEAKKSLDNFLQTVSPNEEERTPEQRKKIIALRSKKDYHTCVAINGAGKFYVENKRLFPGFDAKDFIKPIESRISRGQICSRVCERLSVKSQ